MLCFLFLLSMLLGYRQYCSHGAKHQSVNQWMYQVKKVRVMYLCVTGIHFASFYNFSIEFWNCSGSVVFLFIYFYFFIQSIVNVVTEYIGLFHHYILFHVPCKEKISCNICSSVIFLQIMSLPRGKNGAFSFFNFCYAIKESLRIYWLRNKSWKPECVEGFNMDGRILVFHPEPESRGKIY